MSKTTDETLRTDVEQVLLADGTLDRDSTMTAAGLAADLVRFLNHATLEARDAEQALPYPAVTSSVIASVQTLAQPARMAQLAPVLARDRSFGGRVPLMEPPPLPPATPWTQDPNTRSPEDGFEEQDRRRPCS